MFQKVVKDVSQTMDIKYNYVTEISTTMLSYVVLES